MSGRAPFFSAAPHRGPRSSASNPARAGFTLLEILMALALVALLLVAMNTFIFSMGELWGRNNEMRLFEQHARAVTRFLQAELRVAALPPSAVAGATPLVGQEVRPEAGSTENLLTFELPDGCRLIHWPDHPLPEVVCSLQVRDREGLFLLWHSRLEKGFEDNPPHETLVTPFVTAMTYDYYDAEFRTWKNEPSLRRDPNTDTFTTPQRLRLTFTYGKLTREMVLTLPDTPQALPNF